MSIMRRMRMIMVVVVVVVVVVVGILPLSQGLEAAALP